MYGHEYMHCHEAVSCKTTSNIAHFCMLFFASICIFRQTLSQFMHFCTLYLAREPHCKYGGMWVSKNRSFGSHIVLQSENWVASIFLKKMHLFTLAFGAWDPA